MVTVSRRDSQSLWNTPDLMTDFSFKIHAISLEQLASPPSQSIHAFTWRCLITIFIGLFGLQCSWTPQVETIIHDSPDVFISLRTTDSLKVSPQHPLIIPHTLLRNILEKITETEEGGIIQQLFITTLHS